MHGAGTVAHSASAADAEPVTVDFTVAGISSTSMFEELEAVARGQYSDFQPLVYREEDGEVLPVWNVSMLRGALAAYAFSETGLDALTSWLGPNSANPGLRYVDSAANGYGLAIFTEDQLEVQLVTMEDCRSDFSTPPAIRHSANFILPYWRAGEQPDLQGPLFEGGAPFPFEAPAG